MTIRRGQDWATNGPLAAGAPVLADDAALRAHVERARRSGVEPGEVGLLGGDLCRTLGGPGRADRLHGDEAVRAPIDVVRAVLDGREHWFVAHLVAHRRCWSGEAAVAMNAEWLGRWKLGPRAHPNDGLVDLTRGSLPWQQRLEARRRARTGNHLPHPRLRTERSGTVRFELPVATPTWLDGVAVGRVLRVELTVEADAVLVVV
ncbi:MAG: hypothetical protein IT196_10295 [Acidimicrobiales bacterium]|nr:hypothetical protein [Acidimicrobiales bacterium]